MLISPTHLRDELLALDADIGALRGRRVALLGFRDPHEARIADNVRQVGEVARWAFVDVRNLPGGDIARVLSAAAATAKLVMLFDSAVGMPTDGALLVRALHDDRDVVSWKDGSATTLPATCKLYVVASGARSVDELPPLLRRIDFMTFVRPRV